MPIQIEKIITPYPEIDPVLTDITQRIQALLEDTVIGVYLYGSLTYGDYNPGRSDIDLMVIVKEPLTKDEIEAVTQLHRTFESDNPQWHHRIEASYTPVSFLSLVLPPKQPRPYYGEGKMWTEADYGNEWIINLYLLDKYGITLSGKDIHELIKDVDIKDVQEACVRDLYKEWEPKLRESDWLENSHYQSYLVLNLCRILYTVSNADAKSKRVSADWVNEMYPQWQELIDTAQNWDYSQKMDKQQETLDFLKFVIDKVPNIETL